MDPATDTVTARMIEPPPAQASLAREPEAVPRPPAAWPELDLEAGLRALGHAGFRPGQREAIEALGREGRLLYVAPTGGGKSLVYQLPASLLPGTAIVVSPLIALMHDQVAALSAAGVPATYLASTVDGPELRARLSAIARGAYKLVYVAPERLAYPGFRSLATRIGCPLVAVDEAHCISEWGHDFRPDYLAIGGLLQDLPGARVLACTATATPVVRDEILARLGLGAGTPQIVRGFARPNLRLAAHAVQSARERQARVDAKLAEALGVPGAGRGTVIVYASTRRATEQEAGRLAGARWRAAAYHAGLEAAERTRVHGELAQGRLEVVVATNAFGMGIDRPDVRAVVHLSPPGSIEAYYQEVGRAGRDGAPASGLLLWAANDVPLRRRLLEMPTDGRAPDPRVVEHKWNLFLELLRWAEGATCRHDALLAYFGTEDALEGCGRCDVCERIEQGDETSSEEATTLARKALSAVARVHGRLGLVAAAKLLIGDDDPRLQRLGLDRTTTFGVLRGEPEAWVTSLLRRCVTAGWAGFTGGDRPVVMLTPDGRAVMRGDRPARWVPPPRARAPERPGAPRPPRDAEGGARRGARAAAPSAGELDAAGQALFETLRGVRLELARAAGFPPYMVASDRTLRDLALLRPKNRGELLLAHGLGPAKADRWGDALLDAIQRHATA